MKAASEDLTPEALQALLAEIAGLLPEATYRRIKGWLERLVQLTTVLERKNLSIHKLRQIIFGSKTEKTTALIPAAKDPTTPENKPASKTKRTPARGHGRRGADAFPTATVCPILHPDYHVGDICPGCLQSTLYRLAPTRQLHFEGQPPIAVSVYEQERLRCGLCGELYTAPLPVECDANKYAPSAVAMIALLKYGQGMPWYRLSQLQSALEVPLAPSTQWQLLNSQRLAPQAVQQALIALAAQAPLLHNDDTSMRIMQLERTPGDQRTGVFTSAIVARDQAWQIALYFTGTHHAGENLGKVLVHRQPGRDPPLQMCDALERNLSPSFATIVGNCLAHGRRKFVDVIAQFPEECRFVLLILSQVYCHDDHCRSKQLSDDDRLAYHQTYSAPKMEALHCWMEVQFNAQWVEPNSGLGKAITYMQRHWEKLNLFLRVPGAPLDNNIAERVLKRAILHRKNALFYKTQAGANLGDIYMSLIHTCQLNRINPFDYLTAILKSVNHVLVDPTAWLPWNYKSALSPTA